MMKNEINLQDGFLNVVRQQSHQVTVFLTNGFQMRGLVRGFDHFVVILESDGVQKMVYKHAISTIIPQNRVELYQKREGRSGETS